MTIFGHKSLFHDFSFKSPPSSLLVAVGGSKHDLIELNLSLQVRNFLTCKCFDEIFQFLKQPGGISKAAWLGFGG